MTTQSPPQPDTAVALIQGDESGLHATGAFERFRAPFRGDATPGDLFLIERRAHVARPLRRLGRPSSVQAVIEALALDAGARPYTADQEARAEQLAAAGENFPRRDLTGLPTFTIDGESTRDFDDAISARVEGDAIRVWVHVADVSAYMRPGSELDREARRRATSLYLPTRTVPMLPEALSAGVCSLQPGVERAAVTCEVLLRDGAVIERDFYRSRIKSGSRLTYDHVDQIFLGRLEPGLTYKAALAAARQAAIDRNTDERVDYGEEEQFIIDQGEVVGVAARRQGESHRLIERLMVLANQQVAGFLAERGVPTLYRTHAQTSADRLKSVLGRLRSLGVQVDQPTLEAAHAAVDAYETAHGPNPALRGLLLSARTAAAYGRDVAGHEGLGLDAYCHFTSPIRRYADLVVHRALLAELGAEPMDQAPRFTQLPALAEHLTERALQAKRLERRAQAVCRVSLLRYRIREEGLDRQGDGVVMGISNAGCFVMVHGVEGLLSARDLPGAPDEHMTTWQGPRTLRLGDRVAVRIRTLDPVRGQLRLTLV